MKQAKWDDKRMRIIALIEERVDELESIKHHEAGLTKYGKAYDYQYVKMIDERIDELRNILKKI